jgi:tetratricopeptide (TPR) repeat protein
MEDNLKHLELIEAYLEGNLSEEEKVDFEVRLLVDKDLEEEFELYKKIVGGFKDIQTENIRQKLQAIDDEIDSNSHKPSTKFYWWAGIAAVLLGVLFIHNFYSPSNKFSKDLIPTEEGLPVLMSTNSNLVFDNAMSQFKYGNYNLASKEFSIALKKNPTNDTTLYFLSISFLQNGDYKESIKILNELMKQPNSKYYEKGEFYLALSYWAENRNKEALLLLNKISNDKEHPFFLQSKAIVNKFR